MQQELEVKTYLFDNVALFASPDLDLQHVLKHLAADCEEPGISAYKAGGLTPWISARQDGCSPHVKFPSGKLAPIKEFMCLVLLLMSSGKKRR